jgi:hypothetical chaperone protein
MPSYCGLDFGTSNSTVATIGKDGPFLIPVEDSRTAIPTVVFFRYDDNKILYGQAAIGEYVSGTEGRQMRSLKSILGTELMYEKTRLAKTSVAFADVIGAFIRQLKRQAETFLGDAVDSVVLGRPVHFVDNDAEGDGRAQSELEAIARKQGFHCVEFQLEPIAAAMAYQTQVQRRAVALIIDAGGGTSDFSVVELHPTRGPGFAGGTRILASHGVRIGGTDFDASIARRSIMPLLGYLCPLIRGGPVMPSWIYGDLSAWRKINFLYTDRLVTMVRELKDLASEPHLVDRLLRVLRSRLGHAILMEVERAKIDLTSSDLAACDLTAIEDGLSVSISNADLGAAIGSEMRSIFAGIAETVRLAGLRFDQIGKVFTTGGSTAVPMMSHWIDANFPAAEVVEGDRFGSVGKGLALDAQQRFA